MSWWLKSLTPCCVLGLVIGGCLEREEEITVEEDGSIVVEHTITGDPQDLDRGDAHLPRHEPFESRRFTRPRENGDDEHVLTARAVVSNAADLPHHFAPADDVFVDAALHFTTQVLVHEQDGRKSYLFIRVYRPRSYARFHYWRSRAFSDELEKHLEKDFHDLAREEQLKVLAAFLEYERRKNHEFLAMALEKLELSEEQRALARLDGERAVDRFFEENLGLATAEKLLDLPEDELKAATEALEEKLKTRGLAAVHEAFGGGSGVDVEGLKHELELAQTTFETTEDLGDEKFRVTVNLPGKIVGSNGEVTASKVTWHFKSDALRDREHVLVARSVLEK